MPDIYETLDFGYDLPEDFAFEAVPIAPTKPPLTCTVKSSYLPPPGKQTTPSCFVWSTVYGLATFRAAKLYSLDPTSTDNQASPIYTYIQIELNQKVAANTCKGGKMLWPLQFLQFNGGTATMTDAPNIDGCSAAWTAWGSNTLQPNPNFAVPSWKGVEFTASNAMSNIQNLIFQDIPIAFGCWLYNDFVKYAGSPSPYVGSGVFAPSKTPSGKVGHCMVIIGYDTTMGPNGAVLIQNSFGTDWGGTWNGSGGYVWMDFQTFLKTSQGGGCYLT